MNMLWSKVVFLGKHKVLYSVCIQSPICILYAVCSLHFIPSLHFNPVCSLHFILTGCESYIPLNIYPKYPTPENTPQKIPLEHTKSRGAWGETTTPDFSCARKRMPATQARRYPDAPIPTSCSSKYLESTFVHIKSCC